MLLCAALNVIIYAIVTYPRHRQKRELAALHTRYVRTMGVTQRRRRRIYGI